MNEIDYLPDEPASRHTRSRNTIVFSSEEQLIPEHRSHLGRYKHCFEFLSQDDRVLDCACGCGYGTHILAGKCAQVVGVDLYGDLIEFAKSHWARPNIEYLQADVTSPLPFPDNSFSAIVSLETIEHVSDPVGLLREFRRVLKKHGQLLLSTPQAPMGNPHHVREFQLGELARELDAAGLPLHQSFVQTDENEFLPLAAPVAGVTNFIVAGPPPETSPLSFVADNEFLKIQDQHQAIASLEEQIKENFRRYQQEREASQTRYRQLEEIKNNLQTANKSQEERIAELRSHITKVERELHNIENLRVMRLYRALCRLLRRG